MTNILLLSKNFVFSELYIFLFPILEQSRKERHIQSYENEKCPDNIRYKSRSDDYEDSGKYENYPNKVHRLFS